MAIEQHSGKPGSSVSKPARDQRVPAPPPQIRPAILNEGPELVRDSHC